MTSHQRFIIQHEQTHLPKTSKLEGLTLNEFDFCMTDIFLFLRDDNGVEVVISFKSTLSAYNDKNPQHMQTCISQGEEINRGN